MTHALRAHGAAWDADPKGRRRLAVLAALAETFVPSVRPPRGAPEMGGFWVRTPTDEQVHLAAAGWIETRLRPDDRKGLLQLLDLMAVMGMTSWPRAARERFLLAKAPADIRRGLSALRELTVSLHYGLPDESGSNPSWEVMGYPGPPALTPPADRPRISPWQPPAGQDAVTLSADVVIVGSGSGGGVIAGVLAAAGKDVVVLEAGGHYEEHNFPEHELDAFQSLYWRGGFTPSDDGKVSLVAGATLGGGSTVNWTNCVLTPDRRRSEWAEAGLKDLDTPQFDEHLDAVKERISATEECSELNGPNARMKEGAEALGWSWKCVLRNTDPATYDAASAGHMGFGDRSGSRQGTVNTYLHDAAGAGARILVRTKAQRVLTKDGRASGVAAVMHLDGRDVAVTVSAPTVVVACGALETPALLLRSQIGGPAVGHNLWLHPSTGMTGLYDEPQQAWWGAPHTGIVNEFAEAEQGYGFLIEGIHYGAAYFAGSLPWHGGRDHKVLMSRAANFSSLITVMRDRGAGRVVLGPDGDAFVTYDLVDPLDVANMHRALAALAQVHEAAGARAILDFVNDRRVLWRRGTDLDAFIARSQSAPLRLPHRVVGSAHQMGTARMGTDTATSVADPEGQVHTTPGVWIGDTSAFPSALGVNPMLTCMALSRRTAHAILAA